MSGLAAYVQQPPPDRVGWVHVRRVWLPNWRPTKWAYEVQHLEVTFDSYEELERLEAEQLDHEPWEVLMLTRHLAFLTDQLSTVETFFSQFTEKAQYIHHPDRVECPHEYANEEMSDETPARWSLIRRAWVRQLLSCKEQGLAVRWDTPGERLQGQVTDVSFNSFVISTIGGGHRKSFSDRFGAQLSHIEDDGYIRSLWKEPSARTALYAESLPVWNSALARWEYPEEPGLSGG